MFKPFKSIQKDWSYIVICMAIISFLLIVLGFLLNGIYPEKYKFDLRVMVSLVASIISCIGALLGRHIIDSIFNSTRGSMPIYKAEDLGNGNKNIT